jgi:hypothetical protein
MRALIADDDDIMFCYGQGYVRRMYIQYLKNPSPLFLPSLPVFTFSSSTLMGWVSSGESAPLSRQPVMMCWPVRYHISLVTCMAWTNLHVSRPTKSVS